MSSKVLVRVGPIPRHCPQGCHARRLHTSYFASLRGTLPLSRALASACACPKTYPSLLGVYPLPCTPCHPTKTRATQLPGAPQSGLSSHTTTQRDTLTGLKVCLVVSYHEDWSRVHQIQLYICIFPWGHPHTVIHILHAFHIHTFSAYISILHGTCDDVYMYNDIVLSYFYYYSVLFVLQVQV